MKANPAAVLIVFILFFLLIPLSAENIRNPGIPFIRNFTPVEYNAHPQNWTIVQDNRGVMYFGNTNRGLIEFDGSQWRRIKVANNSSIRSLALAGDGTVYVGAVGTFGFLKSDAAGRRHYISLVDRIKKEDRDFTYVWNIHVTSHGIYFNTSERLYRWYNDKMDVFSVNALQFSFAVYGRVLIPRTDGGISVMEKGRLRSLKLCESKLCKDPFVKVLISPYDETRGIILIATEKKGFYLYDLGSHSFLKRFPTEIDDYVAQNGLYSTARLNDTCFAYGTQRGGIIFMDRKGKQLKVIDKIHGLQDNSVWSLYVDRDRNLWAALNIGISYIETRSPLTRFSEPSGLPGAVVSVVKYRDDIYAGTFSGIFRLSARQRYFLPVSNYKGTCWSFLQVNDALLASGRGVVKVEGSSAVRLTDEAITYCLGHSEKIPGVVFFGRKRGVGRLETNAAGSFVYKGEIKRINGSVRKIVADDKGDLWLTTRYKGILHLKFRNNHIAHPEITHYGVRHGLPRLRDNWVHRIGKDIFAATPRGIYKAVKGADGQFRFVPETTFGKRFTQHAKAVSQVYVDRQKTYWINSSLGFGAVTRWDAAGRDQRYSWDPVPFKKVYGEFESFFIEQSGTIWLASSAGAGLIRYDPGIKKNYKRNYNTLIRKVTVNHHSVVFNGDRRSRAGNGVPVLDYRDNTVSFEYAAVFYEHPDATRFKTILDGFDEHWSGWTRNTSKEYTNLPFGNYCFKVKALNTFRHESSEATYRFIISPPWYRTATAYIGYAAFLLLIVILLILFHFYRIRLLIARERRKYQLAPDVADRYVKKLLLVMETEKPYLDPCLHIDQLAEKICIPGYQLSQLINKKLNRNFFDFINEYRINKAIGKLSGPEGKTKNILQIAYEVGFNSRSSFNTAFKKFTGASPSQFKKSL
jgi:AraC-like DNA-binding protein